MLTICFFFTSITYAQPDYLYECFKKQGQALHNGYIKLSYTESTHRLYHSMSPWQTYRTSTFGTLWTSSAFLFKRDSLQGKKRLLSSFTEYDGKLLVMTDFGDTTIQPVAQSDIDEYLFESARYSPFALLSHLVGSSEPFTHEVQGGFAIYSTLIGNSLVKLYIRTSDFILVKTSMLTKDDLLGDVTNTCNYEQYADLNGIQYPKLVVIEKVNGMVHDTVTITSASNDREMLEIPGQPAEYSVHAEAASTADTMTVEKFSDHIHFAKFKHADSRSLIAEFDHFILVAEAPMTSDNGEQIIRSAKAIAPTKPIRYFTYGHWHPWYVGGVRAFIHSGATIIRTDGDSSYVRYLANARHSLMPDGLEFDPQPLKTQQLRDSMTISDGNYSMTIYHIGEESDHTKDYSIFYFPKEKMVFEGDLAWIKKDAAPKKPDSRQTGLYNAIKKRNLEVAKVVQAWPIAKYDLKSIFEFTDLEEAMKAK